MAAGEINMRILIMKLYFRLGLMMAGYRGFVLAVLGLTALAMPMAELSAGAIKDQPVTVLFIGDSHAVGSFGKREDELLRAIPGFSVATYASCGSSPQSWFTKEKTGCGYFFKDADGRERRGLEAETPLIADLLKAHQPRYTVVALGANLYGGPLEWVRDTSAEMAQAIVRSGSRCVWIGPPQGRNEPEPELGRLFDILRAAVGPYCLLIDSRKYTAYPAVGGDGIHFDSIGESGQRTAEEWALFAFNAFSPVLKSAKPAK